MATYYNLKFTKGVDLEYLDMEISLIMLILSKIYKYINHHLSCTWNVYFLPILLQ